MSERFRHSSHLPAAVLGLAILAGCTQPSENMPSELPQAGVATETTQASPTRGTESMPSLPDDPYYLISNNTCTVTKVVDKGTLKLGEPKDKGEKDQRHIDVSFRVDRPSDVAAFENAQVTRNEPGMFEDIEAYVPLGKQPKPGEPMTMRKVPSYYDALLTGSVTIDRTQSERPEFGVYLPANNTVKKGTQVILFHTVNLPEGSILPNGDVASQAIAVRKACDGAPTYDGRTWSMGKTPDVYLQNQTEVARSAECDMSDRAIQKLEEEIAQGKASSLGNCEPTIMNPAQQ